MAEFSHASYTVCRISKSPRKVVTGLGAPRLPTVAAPNWVFISCALGHLAGESLNFACLLTCSLPGGISSRVSGRWLLVRTVGESGIWVVSHPAAVVWPLGVPGRERDP